MEVSGWRGCGKMRGWRTGTHNRACRLARGSHKTATSDLKYYTHDKIAQEHVPFANVFGCSKSEPHAGEPGFRRRDGNFSDDPGAIRTENTVQLNDSVYDSALLKMSKFCFVQSSRMYLKRPEATRRVGFELIRRVIGRIEDIALSTTFMALC